MLCLIFLTLASLHLSVNGDRYIEKQDGGSNYAADLEDISFLVFYDGVPGDYDYSYDYSDLTVKPEEGSSTSESSLLNPTTESSTQNPNTESSTQNPSTEKLSTSTFKPEVTNKPNLTMEHPLNTENFQIPVVVVTEGTKLKKGYVSSSTLRKKQQQPPVETESLPKRTCLHGFVLDEKNRCKKKITARSPKPALPGGLRYPQRPQQLPETE